MHKSNGFEQVELHLLDITLPGYSTNLNRIIVYSIRSLSFDLYKMARQNKNESKHDVFVRCISDRLKKLNVCDSHDEYVCISESISSSVSPDETPTEDELGNASSDLSDYFDDISSDAKMIIYNAAYEAWGEDVAHITSTVLDGDDDSSGKRECSNSQNDTDETVDFNDENDDGDMIGEGECELCEREVKLTRHHLIPKSTWPRMKKRLWNSAPLIESLNSISSQIDNAKSNEKRVGLQEKKQLLKEKLEKILGTSDLDYLPRTITHDNVRRHLTQVCSLCRQCHSAVHRIKSEWELATDFNTMDRLLEVAEIMKFGRWASKQRPGKYAI